MRVQEETWEQCCDEIAQLLYDHWQEVEWYKDSLDLAPDWERYRILYDNQMLFPFTARTDSGELIGYALFFLSPMLHHKQVQAADCDLLYFKPEHRGGIGAVQLLKYVQAFFKEWGVSLISIGMKSDHPFTKLMDHLGYDLMEYSYTRRIQ